MRKTMLAACAAVAVVAPSASATGTCAALTDPAGDTMLYGTQVAAPLPGGLDLVGADVVASDSAVSVTFALHGAPDPAPGTSYEYSLEFEDAAAEFDLHAGLDGGAHLDVTGGVYELLIGWKDEPPVGGGGGPQVVRYEKHPVSGSVDLAANTVTVTAPAALFGAASIPAGRTWTVAGARTGTAVFGAGQNYSTDFVPGGGATLVAGDGAC